MKHEARQRRSSFLQMRLPAGIDILCAFAIMALLIAGVYVFDIPNPNMILIAGLVVSSALFGYPGGWTATVIMALYTLFFFSTNNDFVSFTPTNLTKVFVSLFGIVVDMVFVCALKRREILDFREVEKLTEELRRDNNLLQQASMIDSLTGIRNRFALRRDFPEFIGQDVFVMMLDVDDFKSINDTYGHETGDFFLTATGGLLAQVFGREHCYRYGGDEFLVICRDITEDTFQSKLDEIIANSPAVEVDGQNLRPGYSCGHARGTIRENDDLRRLFNEADAHMYHVKRGKGE